jgi:hypothetical protein
LDLHGKKKQQQHENTSHYHRKSQNKKAAAAAAQGALDTQEQQQVQSSEEALVVLSDLASRSDFDGDVDDKDDEDEFVGEDDKVDADDADVFEALFRGGKGKKDDGVVFVKTILAASECSATKDACDADSKMSVMPLRQPFVVYSMTGKRASSRT